MKLFINIFWSFIKVIGFILLFFLLLTIIAVFIPQKINNPSKFIKSTIKKDLSNCINIKSDTYHLQDGYTFISFDCSSTDILDQIYGWKKLPLTDTIDKTFDSSLIDKTYSFNKPINGYYYFNGKDYNNDLKIYTDYTIAIYDTDNQYFYYYELDS